MLKVSIINPKEAEVVILENYEKFIISGRDNLSARDIRIFQLAMMISGKKITSLEKAKKEIEKVNSLNERDLGRVVKNFELCTYSKDIVVQKFEKGIFPIILSIRSKKAKESISTFLISDYITLENNVYIKTLRELGITKWNSLSRCGIKTVNDIIRFTEKQLMDECRGIGEVAIIDIREKLEKVGMKLKEY